MLLPLLILLISTSAQAGCDPTQASGGSADAPFEVPFEVKEIQKAIYKMTERTSVAPCPRPWHCDSISFQTEVSDPLSFEKKHSLSADLRAGYIEENPRVPFKGNILFYEGLGDSMVNHLPLFRRLSEAGFRVISFDYMGQGGSTGNMDNTRIDDIPKIGDLAWKKFARETQKFPEKNTIGWSTGGLAAYDAAHGGLTHKVVLIAPGIAANFKIGENRLDPFELDEITLPTLTTANYTPANPNPHLDPIRPVSPLAVPDFSIDLQEKGRLAREKWEISPQVHGLTLLSGPNDTYVNAEKTRAALNAHAPGFRDQIVQYPGALHEIDNEDPSISLQAQEQILRFFNEKR